MRLQELANLVRLAPRTIRFYITKGLLPPPTRVGREGYFDDGHVERLRQIERLQEQGRTLAQIGQVLVSDSDGEELPEPRRAVVYAVTDDVTVHIDASVSPQRHRQVRNALMAFSAAVQTRELPDTGLRRQSGKYIELFDELGVGYFLTGRRLIDNSRALRFRGQSIRAYFNDATRQREAFFALNEAFYAGFRWQHWRDTEVPRTEQSHVKRAPLEGQEREAFEGLIKYLKDQRPDLYVPP